MKAITLMTLTRVASIAAAGIMAASALAPMPAQADRAGAVVGGLVAGAVLGAAIGAAPRPSYYYGGPAYVAPPPPRAYYPAPAYYPPPCGYPPYPPCRRRW